MISVTVPAEGNRHDRTSASLYALKHPGEVAQLVEHTTENRGVASSILALAIRTT